MLKSFFHKSEGYSRSVQIASNYPTFHFKPCLTPIFKECWVTEAFALDGYRTEANGVHYNRPQTNLWKGNVFTPVCQSFCSQGRVSAQGGCVSQHALDRPPSADTPTPVSSLLECILVLYRMFVCEGYVFTRVCHSVHGGGLPHCMLGYTPRTRGKHPPDRRQVPPTPGADIPPWDQRQAPPPGPEAGTPPPEQTTLGADTPSGPEAGTPPGAVHAGRYGQQAGGTHPTGMQSCITQNVLHCV